MGVKVPVEVSISVMHHDEPGYILKKVTEKSQKATVIVELPENFVAMVDAFDKGTTELVIEAKGRRVLTQDYVRNRLMKLGWREVEANEDTGL